VSACQDAVPAIRTASVVRRTTCAVRPAGSAVASVARCGMNAPRPSRTTAANGSRGRERARRRGV